MKKNLGIIALIVAIAAVFSFAFDFTGANAQQTKVTVSDSGSRKSRPSPTPRTAYWTGNGASYDGENFEFTSSRCEESEGQPYIYWVLTAGGRDSLDNAQISINGSSSIPMTRVSKGSFKYTQTFESGFVVPTSASATYTTAKSASLVISHGCTGEVVEGPSFTLSFDSGIAPFPFQFEGADCDSGGGGTSDTYNGETFEVCDTGGSNTNVYIGVPSDYSVTSSPEANCIDFGKGWLCTVTDPDTVITITAPPAGSPSFSLAGILGQEASYDFNPSDCSGMSDNYPDLDDTLNEVCDDDTTPNVVIRMAPRYRVSSSPEANCQADAPNLSGYNEWLCTVTAPNTVITITELPSFLFSIEAGITGTYSFKDADCNIVGPNNLSTYVITINLLCRTVPPANVQFTTDQPVTVTTDAPCVFLGSNTWACAVSEPNEVITLAFVDSLTATSGIQPPLMATSPKAGLPKR